MDDNFEIIEQPTPPKNRCIIVGSAIEEEYKIFINYQIIAKAMKHGLKDTINELGGLLTGNIYSDKRIDDDFLYVDVKDIYPIARVGVQKKFSFSEEELENLKEEAAEKNPDSTVVGWYHSHPGWGVDLSDEDQDTHMNFFNHNSSVLLVVESVSKDFAIYKTDEKDQRASKSKGYVIYCDTNDEIPKMKKLVDMVEQNRERKKDKVIKPPEEDIQEETEASEETEEEKDFFLSPFHPNVLMIVMGTIIIALIIILAIGAGKFNELKRELTYTQGGFSIDTRDPKAGEKEIFLDSDFIEGTLKIVVFSDEGSWKIKEIYIKEGSAPFRILAMDISQPEPLEQTPLASTTPSEDMEDTDNTPVPADNEGDEEIIKDRVRGWIESWEGIDIDRFKSFYSDSFANSVTDKVDLWIENRISAGIFEGEPDVMTEGEIEVEFLEPHKAEVKFIQNFKGVFNSRGTKILVFTREGGDWLITGEDFQEL